MLTNHEEMGPWAQTIIRDRYAHTIGGQKETWAEIASRVARNVMSAVDAPQHLVQEITRVIRERKFMPGGRYLAASGRRMHQTQNCVLLRAEDSREGWSRHYYQANMALMTGAGVGGEYSAVRPEFSPLKRTSGYASGPMPLIQGINEMGRAAKQGGSRRAAIWAGLKWWHTDAMKLVDSKNWDDDIRAKKALDFNYPAPLDHTNISVGLDSGFFPAMSDPTNPQHGTAQSVYWRTVRNMLETAEPGFSIDIGENEGEDLRNAPVCAETKVLTDKGYVTVGSIVDQPVTIWTGWRWAEGVVFTKTMENAPIVKVTMSNGRFIRCEPSHEFLVDYATPMRCPAGELRAGTLLVVHAPEDDQWRNETVVSVEPDGFEDVYCADVKCPEHSFQAEGVIISNCTEVTSRDDSDICNLGSINMARIHSLEEMRQVIELGTAFLLAGTIYSDVPYEKIAVVREKNRRLGLGLMGLHEWLLVRGLKYGPSVELQPYLEAYAQSTAIAATWADQWGVSHPVKTRAIAPTGTIGIAAETTTGLEPIFCAAVKRRYYDHGVWRYQMVVDPTARRLMEMGIEADKIEDAYSLSEDVERRLSFQAWTQGYVDHAISSTINLPAWGTPQNNADTVQSFGETLLRYLPRLRGITCYPDGSRGGQPLTPVDIREALKFEGQVFTETAGDVCSLRGGGSCGA